MSNQLHPSIPTKLKNIIPSWLQITTVLIILSASINECCIFCLHSGFMSRASAVHTNISHNYTLVIYNLQCHSTSSSITNLICFLFACYKCPYDWSMIIGITHGEAICLSGMCYSNIDNIIIHVTGQLQ